VSEEIKVYEIYFRKYKNKNIVIPLFSITGLTSLIADYLIDSFKMEPIAYLNIKEIQPLMYVTEGKVLHPYTLYFSPENSLMVLKTPFPKEDYENYLKIFPKIVDALLDWGERNEVKRFIALDFMPLEEGEETKVHFITEEHLTEEMIRLGLEPYSGVFSSAGTYLLDECMRRRIDGVLLVADSYIYTLLRMVLSKEISPKDLYEKIKEANYDQEALIKMVKALSKVTQVEIPVDKLRKVAKELGKILVESLKIVQKRPPGIVL